MVIKSYKIYPKNEVFHDKSHRPVMYKQNWKSLLQQIFIKNNK